MWDNQTNYVPIQWQQDGQWVTPSYNQRASFYGVSYYPTVIYGGTTEPEGWYNYAGHLTVYNQQINWESPLSIEVDLDIVDDNLIVTADVEVTGEIETVNNKILYVITYEIDDDYFCSVVGWDYEDFTLTTVGETGTFTGEIPYDASWDPVKIKGVAFVQTFSGDNKILQAGITNLDAVVPIISCNITEGPIALGVQFTSLSFPQGEIDAWEWDLDGDGTFDSTEENPYYLYEEEGTYDITLKITVGEETAQTTAVDLITVTGTDNISGSANGIWMAEYSPYTITDEFAIESGYELVIEPGATVITNNDIQFLVYGKLIADAEGEDPIIFTSDDEWKGLKFADTMENSILRNCEISNATLSGVYASNSKVDILHNKFYANSSTALGASIDLNSSDEVNIGYNIIANNTCVGLTGGIGCINSSPNIYNNIIVNNDGYFGGSFSLKNGSNPVIQNNTMANNDAENEFFLFDSFPILLNNIIIKDDDSIFQLINSLPTVSYSCITGGYEGPGNIDEDPMFQDPSEGIGSGFDGMNADWTLADGSPCIDSGHPNASYNDEDGTRNDMGAYGGTGFVTVDADENEIPDVSANSISVYPNPFNPQTSIFLNLSDQDKTGPVDLEVYNLRGQLIKTLVAGQILGNEQTVIWTGTDNTDKPVPSGIYFARLKTFSGTSTAKMLLVK